MIRLQKWGLLQKNQLCSLGRVTVVESTSYTHTLKKTTERTQAYLGAKFDLLEVAGVAGGVTSRSI